MIARIWRGRTPASLSTDYFQFLLRSGVPDYAATPGHRGTYILRSLQGEEAYFLLLSLWDDLDAIKRFAGHDYQNAVYYPEDDSFLLEKEPTVSHYEVLHSPGEVA